MFSGLLPKADMAPPCYSVSIPKLLANAAIAASRVAA
jgi:hypothetical protein